MNRAITGVILKNLGLSVFVMLAACSSGNTTSPLPTTRVSQATAYDFRDFQLVTLAEVPGGVRKLIVGNRKAQVGNCGVCYGGGATGGRISTTGSQPGLYTYTLTIGNVPSNGIGSSVFISAPNGNSYTLGVYIPPGGTVTIINVPPGSDMQIITSSDPNGYLSDPSGLTGTAIMVTESSGNCYTLLCKN